MINPIAVATRPLTLLAVGLTLVLAGTPGSAPGAASAAQEPREITVLVGAGQDTAAILSFFPQTVRIHVGDTIRWEQNSDDTHTVSFVTGAFPGPGTSSGLVTPGQTIPVGQIPVPGRPGVTQVNPPAFRPSTSPEVQPDTYSGVGFVSSGRFRGVPDTPGIEPITSFSLTFDTPGVFPYLCLVHPTESMAGTVEVVDVLASVPSQAEIDAQAQAEIAALTAFLERAKAQVTAPVRREPGPNNTDVWFVRAGNIQAGITDFRVQLLEFLPRDLTIRAGDTVIWGSVFFHTVTFNPAPPPPSTFFVDTLADGSEAVIRNPQIFDAAKPAGVFDPTRYFNSAALGPNPGNVWALAFETPGIFEYFCGIHREAGMVGSITVVPRS